MSLTSVPSRSANVYVLDSWPLLEQLLKLAPLAELDALMEAAARREVILLMSEINLGEVYYRLAREGGDDRAEEIMLLIARLPIQILPVSPGDVLNAARLKARFAISYADCFCAGIAVAHKAAVVTGDPDFLQLEQRGLLRVEWVGA